MSKRQQLEAMRQAASEQEAAQAMDLEIKELDFIGKPESMPADVWEMVQDNGRLATEKLNEVLRSPRFARLRAGDQARLIKLAQDRAYGAPQAAKADTKAGKYFDVTKQQLDSLAKKATLPEYKK